MYGRAILLTKNFFLKLIHLCTIFNKIRRNGVCCRIENLNFSYDGIIFCFQIFNVFIFNYEFQIIRNKKSALQEILITNYVKFF